MKVRILGNPPAAFLDRVRAHGFEITDVDPAAILAYGGDGTLIGAERDFPGIPKLGFRTDESCNKCDRHTDDVVLKALKAGTLTESRLLKLEGRWRTNAVCAMNDITFRNADPRAAVRFIVSLDGHRVTDEVIGDGLVVATPFGSSAYFRSITHMAIRTGVGVAFNNCADFIQHLVIAEHEKLTIELVRGPATLTSDNDPRLIPMETGERLEIHRAAIEARLLAVDTLRCPDCRYVNAPRRRY